MYIAQNARYMNTCSFNPKLSGNVSVRGSERSREEKKIFVSHRQILTTPEDVVIRQK